MHDVITMTNATEVEAALLTAALIPPPPPASLGSGAMAELRDRMARFSGPLEHTARRATIDELIATIDQYPFAGEAHRRATNLLAKGIVGPELAPVVPVETMATALGVEADNIAQVRADVGDVARTIGRQEPTSPATNASAERLVTRFGANDDAIATVSLLYQTHDATAALFTTMLEAQQSTSPRQPAVTRTVRVAATPTTVAGQNIAANVEVVIDLEQAGFEFGAGPHHCPGRSIAERIVMGMLSALP